MTALLRTFLLTVALLLSSPASLTAHEVPQRVAVIAYVKPDGQTLRVIVRVPLESMRDMQFGIRTDGTLDLEKLGLLLPEAAELWVANYVDFYENGRKVGAGHPVATQLSLPSDRSFTSYDDAVAHVRGKPLPVATQLPYQRAMLDMELEYPITDENARFAMESGLSHLGVKTTTVLHFLAPGKAERAFEYDGNPGMVQLDPRWYQAGLRFVSLGFEHILTGFDHLLFIFCLVIPVRRWRLLAAIVTAFTAAHSITLVASAYGFAPNGSWFPPLVEALIAISIVYMALENMLGRPERLNHRWMLAFGFGLVHGFGFSFALRESLQFAGTHLITSLAAFNIGVELGQLLVLAVALPVLMLVIRKSASERAVVVVASALVAHSGWHWMTERLAVLSEYRVSWPTFDAVLLLGAMRALLLLAIAGAVAWGLSGVVKRLVPEPNEVARDPR
ncbi:MAG: HupE/UreJ family protein [Gemmatimonadaceae bacterium]